MEYIENESNGEVRANERVIEDCPQESLKFNDHVIVGQSRIKIKTYMEESPLTIV